jgi:hypothetical protein
MLSEDVPFCVSVEIAIVEVSVAEVLVLPCSRDGSAVFLSEDAC